MKINGSIVDQNTDDDFDEYYDSTYRCCKCGPPFITVFIVGVYALIEWVLKIIFTGIAIMPETKPSGDPIGIRMINAYKARKDPQKQGGQS